MNKKSDIYVTRATLPSYEEYIEEIRDIWDSHWLTNMGSKHNRLSRELADYLGIDGVELVTNGHNALELTLQAYGLHGEVITTPFTFVSTVSAIVRSGLTPVFCDIKPDDYTIDPDKVEELITDQTCAILPVHVYGNICDVEAIYEIAQNHGLKVIYDAAHAFGIKRHGEGISKYGDASCFSFHATKVFNTIEGGAVCSNDNDLLERIRRMRDFGIGDDDTVTEIGTNAKLNEFAAAMGLCNLRNLEECIVARRIRYEKYLSQLDGISGITVNKPHEMTQSNYSYMPIYVDAEKYGHSRADLFDRLVSEHIHPRKYFYPLISDMPCYRSKYHHGETPVADRISGGIMTLPLYPDLDIEVVDHTCGIIRKLYEE